MILDHIGIAVADFAAIGRAQVNAFHKAALAAGVEENCMPGIGETCHPDNCGAFVLDSDRRNIEAVCHAPDGDEP